MLSTGIISEFCSLHKLHPLIEQKRVQYSSFNPAPDIPTLLLVWHVRKAVPRSEVLLSVIISAQSDSVTLCWGML